MICPCDNAVPPRVQVVLTKGSEPVLLGFKRQSIFLHGLVPSAADPIILSVANAPGLPPIVAVTFATSDSDAASATPPEGYEVIEVGVRTAAGVW